VQKRAQCRDVVKRVTISKSAGGGATDMTTVEEWQRINLRKVSTMLIQHMANRLREESRVPLTNEQAIVKAIDRYPNLAALYDEGHRRGDAPEELMPAAPPTPVVKAGLSKAEVDAEIRKRAAPIAAAQGITMDQAVVKVVCDTPEGKQLYQAYCDARP
jgi:hypothetical protein